MPETIAVSLDPARIQVQPAGQASASILIRNRSEEVRNYTLILEGAPVEWGDITPNQLSAFPYQEARAQVNLHPPAGVQGALYRVTVVVRSLDRPDTEGRALLEMDVPVTAAPAPILKTQVETPAPVAPIQNQVASQIELRFEPVTEGVLPPPAMQWKLRVKNSGNVLDTFGFSFSGIPQTWISLDPVEVHLYPNEESLAQLTVQPPPGTKAGSYPFILRAFSHININQRTEVPLKVDVRANASFQMDITPKEAETQGMRDFQIVFSSSPDANSDLVLDLSASEQDNACDFGFNPREVLLPARQHVASNMRARPRAVLGPNERKQYTLKITATPRQGAAPAQTVEARLTQTAAAPVNLAIQPQMLSAEMEADYVLKVTNPGTVDINLFFSAEDPELACDYTFLPDNRLIPANGTSSTRLHIKARLGHRGDAPRPIAFKVSATRKGDLLPCAAASGGFNQLPGRPIAIELIPPQQSQPGRAKFSVRVNNPFSAPIQIWLDARDENDALEFKFSNQSVQVSPGAAGVFELSANPKDKLLPTDQRRVHKFTVTAQIQGGGLPVGTNGILAQTKSEDLSGPIGKFFGFIGSLLKLAWKFIRWLIPWIIVLIVLIFLADLGIAALYYFVQNDAQLGPIITGLIPLNLIDTLHKTMLFGSISDSIVEAVMKILAVVQQRISPPPTPTPAPTPTP